MEKERQLWNRHFSIDEKEFLSDNLYTIIYYIYEKFGGTKPQYGYAAAASIVLFFIIAVFTLLQRVLQRRTDY